MVVGADPWTLRTTAAQLDTCVRLRVNKLGIQRRPTIGVIEKFLHSSTFIDNYQFGFKRGLSTGLCTIFLSSSKQ